MPLFRTLSLSRPGRQRQRANTTTSAAPSSSPASLWEQHSWTVLVPPHQLSALQVQEIPTPGFPHVFVLTTKKLSSTSQKNSSSSPLKTSGFFLPGLQLLAINEDCVMELPLSEVRQMFVKAAAAAADSTASSATTTGDKTTTAGKSSSSPRSSSSNKKGSSSSNKSKPLRLRVYGVYVKGRRWMPLTVSKPQAQGLKTKSVHGVLRVERIYRGGRFQLSSRQTHNQKTPNIPPLQVGMLLTNLNGLSTLELWKASKQAQVTQKQLIAQRLNPPPFSAAPAPYVLALDVSMDFQTHLLEYTQRALQDLLLMVPVVNHQDNDYPVIIASAPKRTMSLPIILHRNTGGASSSGSMTMMMTRSIGFHGRNDDEDPHHPHNDPAAAARLPTLSRRFSYNPALSNHSGTTFELSSSSFEREDTSASEGEDDDYEDDDDEVDRYYQEVSSSHDDDDDDEEDGEILQDQDEQVDLVDDNDKDDDEDTNSKARLVPTTNITGTSSSSNSNSNNSISNTNMPLSRQGRQPGVGAAAQPPAPEMMMMMMMEETAPSRDGGVAGSAGDYKGSASRPPPVQSSLASTTTPKNTASSNATTTTARRRVTFSPTTKPPSEPGVPRVSPRRLSKQSISSRRTVMGSLKRPDRRLSDMNLVLSDDDDDDDDDSTATPPNHRHRATRSDSDMPLYLDELDEDTQNNQRRMMGGFKKPDDRLPNFFDLEEDDDDDDATASSLPEKADDSLRLRRSIAISNEDGDDEGKEKRTGDDMPIPPSDPTAALQSNNNGIGGSTAMPKKQFDLSSSSSSSSVGRTMAAAQLVDSDDEDREVDSDPEADQFILRRRNPFTGADEADNSMASLSQNNSSNNNMDSKGQLAKEDLEVLSIQPTGKMRQIKIEFQRNDMAQQRRLGLMLGQDLSGPNGVCVLIQHVIEKGLFGKSPLQAGQIIDLINEKPCPSSTAEAFDILTHLKGRFSIHVSAPGARPDDHDSNNDEPGDDSEGMPKSMTTKEELQNVTNPAATSSKVISKKTTEQEVGPGSTTFVNDLEVLSCKTNIRGQIRMEFEKKNNSQRRLGLVLQNDLTGSNGDAIIIQHVLPEGLFGKSPLKPGQIIEKIDEQPCPITSTATFDLLTSLTGHFTLQVFSPEDAPENAKSRSNHNSSTSSISKSSRGNDSSSSMISKTSKGNDSSSSITKANNESVNSVSSTESDLEVISYKSAGQRRIRIDFEKKRNSKRRLGLVLQQDLSGPNGSCIVIQHVLDGGLFGKSPLQSGQILDRINGKPCPVTTAETFDLLTSLTGKFSLSLITP